MVSVTSSVFDATLLAVRILPSANPAFSTIPKHIGFLMDTSGSMAHHNRLSSVKKTLDLFIEAKPAAYQMTLVAFAGSATVVAEAARDSASLHAAVSSLVASGGTNMEAGILCLREIHRRIPMDAVILLTDGEVTAGDVTTTAGLQSLVLSAFPTKIPVHTIGFGEGYNRALLVAIAKMTRSLHMYADAAEALPAVAGDVLAGVMAEIGTNAVLRFPPAYTCLEGTEVGEYTIGTLIAEKEQWVLLSCEGTHSPVIVLSYKGSDGEYVSHTVPVTTDLRRVDMAAQRDRIQSTQAMTQIYDAIEGGRYAEGLALCRSSLASLEASEATEESMVLCLKAQFAELVEQLTGGTGVAGAAVAIARTTALPPQFAPLLLSRLASNTAALATQRGFVSRMASGGSDTHTFSSPGQQAAHRSMTNSYADSP